MIQQLKPGDNVIIRGVYTKGVKPKFDADLCTDTDYVGCTGVVSDIKGDQVLVTIGLAHVNGEAIYGSHKLIFAVSMLEGR